MSNYHALETSCSSTIKQKVAPFSALFGYNEPGTEGFPASVNQLYCMYCVRQRYNSQQKNWHIFFQFLITRVYLSQLMTAPRPSLFQNLESNRTLRWKLTFNIMIYHEQYFHYVPIIHKLQWASSIELKVELNV
jgi:hypothetical protein